MKFRKALSFAISYAIGIVYTKQAEKKTDVFQTFFGLLNNIEYMSDAIAGKSNIRVGAAACPIARGSQIPRGKLGHGLVCSFAPRGGVFDPRGIRQISARERLLGSLLAGIKNLGRRGLWKSIKIIFQKKILILDRISQNIL
jgi:hypothetical protein